MEEGWKPYCPVGHRLPTASIEPLVIGVVGNVNSSKSHFLAGLVHQLVSEQALHEYGVDVAYLGDNSDSSMKMRIQDVYGSGVVLRNTQRGRVDGPFSYTLSLPDGQPQRQLSFFDIAGEDCTTLVNSAKIGRYLYDAAGIVILVDPLGFPLKAGGLTSRGGPEIPLAGREIVDVVATGIEQLTGVHPRSATHQTVVIAIAKADLVDWEDGYWPPPSLDEENMSGRAAGLQEYSLATRRELDRMGGKAIIDAAEARFNPANVFYTRVSATNQSDFDGVWTNPAPVGCADPVGIVLHSQQLIR